MIPFFLTEHFVCSKFGRITVYGSGLGVFPKSRVLISVTLGGDGVLAVLL